MPLGCDTADHSTRRAGRGPGPKAFLFAFLLIASCARGGAGDRGWIRLLLEPATGVDVAAADTLALEVTSGAAVLFQDSFPLDGGEIALDQVPLGADRVFHVEMRDGAAVLAEGSSEPEDLVEGARTTVVIVLNAPTVPSPTPTPAPTNVLAEFDGENDVSGDFSVPDWAGMATLMGSQTRTIGVPDTFDYAYTECFDSGGTPLGPGSERGDIGFCIVDWYGEEKGIALDDALLRLWVYSPHWQDGALVELGENVAELEYYEADNGQNFLLIATGSYGSVLLEAAGFKNPDAVTLANGEFYVPGLP